MEILVECGSVDTVRSVSPTHPLARYVLPATNYASMLVLEWADNQRSRYSTFLSSQCHFKPKHSKVKTFQASLHSAP